MSTAQAGAMRRRTPTRARHALALAVSMMFVGAAQAQLATATIRGQIAAAPAGTQVTARNTETGATYRATVQSDGSYVLPGVAPGSYEVKAEGNGVTRSESVTVAVGQTSAVDLSLSGAQQVTVTGAGQRRGVRTSEVGTNVSGRMIEAMPQSTRNFLSSVDLAPGVAFESSSESGYTNMRGGGQSKDNVNVFIDGVSQKNDILRGGVSGQDSSRGNPFPQSAIAEYKVLTQNYKAEFDKVTSAAVTAVTKSGTNELHGNVYVDRTGTNWRALTPKERANRDAGVDLPSSSKNEYGFSLGGPIKKDTAFFFIAYDGKDIGDSRQIVAQNVDKFTGTGGLIPTFKSASGTQVDKFHEDLLFGKLDFNLSDEQRLSASLRVRKENDRVPEDRVMSLPGNDKNRINDETTLDLKHEWTRDAWLNEARIGYRDATWNPRSNSDAPYVKYFVSTSTPPVRTGAYSVIYGGGSPDAQNRQQKGFYLQDDLTWTGLRGHTIKGGIKLVAAEYNLQGTPRAHDVVETLVDAATGQPYFDGTNCLGTNIVVSGTTMTSDQCKLDRALAPAGVKFKNTQIGLYIQDDWQVSRQLELNLGVRYDIESNMLNNDYVTPADRVAALKGLDTRNVNGVTAAPGQTYADSLAKGGIHLDDYIATGNSRKQFKNGLAPRIGFSYDLNGDRASVLFGGWGRSYDRTMANFALDELQKNAQANGEIWLIRNEFKMPYADQFTLGIRQAVAQWNAELAYSHIDGKNQFMLFSGNRAPDGGYGKTSSIDPLWGGPPGFGNLVLGDFIGQVRQDQILAKLEKPYTRASGWSASIAYTYTDAKTTNKEWNDEPYDWNYGRAAARGWNASTVVDKHRLVAAGFVENVAATGINVSGKLSVASGLPRRLTNCGAGWDQCVYVKGSSNAFRQFDLGVSKDFGVMGHTVTLRADVLNLFNWQNLSGYDDWIGGALNGNAPANKYGGENPNVDKPNGTIRGDARTLRLGVSLKF